MIIILIRTNQSIQENLTQETKHPKDKNYQKIWNICSGISNKLSLKRIIDGFADDSENLGRN